LHKTEIYCHFLKAWEDGFARAKLIIEALYKKEQDKKSFQDKYDIKITLHPKMQSSNFSYVITRYFNPDVELYMRISYDPATKNEDNFRKSIHIKKELSWNIEGLGGSELEGYYICYTLHIPYLHNNWTLEDILSINNIVTEIKVSY